MKFFRQLRCPAQVSSNHQGLEQSNQLKPPTSYGSRINLKAQGGFVFILFGRKGAFYSQYCFPIVLGFFCCFSFSIFDLTRIKGLASAEVPLRRGGI